MFLQTLLKHLHKHCRKEFHSDFQYSYYFIKLVFDCLKIFHLVFKKKIHVT